MAELTIWSHSFEAAGDLHTYINRAVKLSAARTVDVCGANEVAIGILKNAPDVTAAGKACTVALIGLTNMTVNGAGTAIAAGDPIECVASGIGVKCVTDKHNIVAIANGAATADGVEIEVILLGPRQGSI